MIRADIQPTCKDSTASETGYSALYVITEDAGIDEGVILAATIMGEIYLFQLAKSINVFSASSVEYISGSEVEYMEDPPGHIPVEHIPIILVRYPTKAELEWYNKQDLV